ncbi:DUF2268 domain-containing protein [Bacillus salitolerans]|uniref:DUF2268 domain-containing protein n=1 Tax=Bacillus salitolerans TaxID=1437434 RepID=A0ABW4LJL8_9BACI
MGVIDTKTWLKEYGEKPIKVCEQLKSYFKKMSAKEIYDLLSINGMYRPSIFNRNHQLEPFLEMDYWKVVQKYYTKLRKTWNGPDVPIFIFPVNERQQQIMNEFNGKSGLAFPDKLFLFLKSRVDEREIMALLTHEYHHVCRLKYVSKNERDVTLLDTILLEGLAEQAVRKYCGSQYNASWTAYYTDDELQTFYNEFMKPNKSLRISDEQYFDLLYGLKRYPKMLGYCVGFYIVDQCIRKHNLPFSKMEQLSSEEILNYFLS